MRKRAPHRVLYCAHGTARPSTITDQLPPTSLYQYVVGMLVEDSGSVKDLGGGGGGVV
jgi:hypothetical protein